MAKSTSYNKKTKNQFKNLLFSNDLGDLEPDSESINEEYLERVNNTPEHVMENMHNSYSTSPALSISKIEKLNAYVNGDDNESCSKIELAQNNLTKEKDLGIDNPNMNKQCNNDGTVSMYFDKRKIRIAPRSSLQFKVGPPFLETVFFNQITSFLEQKTVLNFELFSRIDRGFDFINNEWIGYKRNYFTLVSSFKIKEFDDDNNIINKNFLIKINASKFNIEYFATRIMAKCFESNEEMSLVQHTAKRDKGPQTTPQIHPLLPSELPNHQIIREASNVRNNIKRRKYDSTFFLHRNNLNSQSIDDDAIIYTYPEDDIKKVARYERVQFASSNTMKKPLQYNKHFKLISVLGAVVKGDLGKHLSTNNGQGYESVFENKKLTFVPIALRETPSLIIRGRSPSNYVSSNVSSVNVVQHAVESFALNDDDMITTPLCESIVNEDIVVTSNSLINVNNVANNELNESNLNLVDEKKIKDKMNVENICKSTNVTESQNSKENTFDDTPSIVNEFLFDSKEAKIAETYTLNKRLSKNERKLNKRIKEINLSPFDPKLLKFNSKLKKNEIYNSDQYGKNGFKNSDYLEKLMHKKLQERNCVSKTNFQTMKNKSKFNKQARESTPLIKTKDVQCIDPRISTTKTLSVSSHDSGDNLQNLAITPHMILNSHIRFKTTSSYEYEFLSGKENNEYDFDTPSTSVRRSLTFPGSKFLKYEPSEIHLENDICAVSSNVKIEINNRHQEMLSLNEAFSNSFLQEHESTEEFTESFYTRQKKIKDNVDDYNDENSHNLDDNSSESPMPPTKYVSLLPDIGRNDKTGFKSKSAYIVENLYSIASDEEMSTPRFLLKNQTNVDLSEFKSELKHKQTPKKTKTNGKLGGCFEVKSQCNNLFKATSSTRVRVKINSTEKNLKNSDDRLYETKLKIQHYLVDKKINDNKNREEEEDQRDEKDQEEEDQCSNEKDVEFNTSYDYNLSMCANYSFSSSIQIDSFCVDN